MSIILLLTALLLAGCGRDDIHTYRVPREGHPEHPRFVRDAANTWTWQAPDGWESADPGPVRLAAWRIPEADGESLATIIPLRGAGDVAASIVRWRLQLGLPAGPAPTTAVETGIGPATMVDIDAAATEGGGRILAAVIPAGDLTLIVKLAGPSAAVAARRDEFLAFLASLEAAP